MIPAKAEVGRTTELKNANDNAVTKIFISKSAQNEPRDYSVIQAAREVSAVIDPPCLTVSRARRADGSQGVCAKQAGGLKLRNEILFGRSVGALSVLTRQR
jgi:hypothetical protein